MIKSKIKDHELWIEIPIKRVGNVYLAKGMILEEEHEFLCDARISTIGEFVDDIRDTVREYFEKTYTKKREFRKIKICFVTPLK